MVVGGDEPLIIHLPTNYVAFYWNQIAPLIEKVLKRNKSDRYYDLDFFKKMLNQDQWQCFAYVPEPEKIQCIFITEIITYPSGYRSLFPHTIGGEGISEWKASFWQTMKEYAVQMGCDEIVGAGRNGWAKSLRRIEPDLEVESKYRVIL